MKKLLFLSLLLVMMILGACGSDEKASSDKDKKADTPATEEKAEDSKDTATTAESKLQEPAEDSLCEMCNMKVYMKDEEMGMFSAQAVKADGSMAFYDDIGCLLNAEVKNKETNEKFVRDFNTLEWVKVEDATIVKDANVKTPMNWSYLSFADKADADAYIAEHEGAFVEELQTIKDAALERMKAKMAKQKEAQQNGNGNGAGNMNMDMGNK